MTDKRIAEELMRTYDVRQVVQWYVQETNESVNEAKERVYKVLSVGLGLSSECYDSLWTKKNRKWLLGSKFELTRYEKYIREEWIGICIFAVILAVILLICCLLEPMYMIMFLGILFFICGLVAK